jgi:membrane protease YdiL (CAAX protease family)
LSDITEDIESKETKQSSKLLILTILFASIAAIATPILIAQIFYGEYGISRNVYLTQLALPGLSLLIMLLAVIFLKKTRIAGALDFIWYRWSRSEVIKAILLILAVPIVYLITGALIRKLGLQLKPDLWYLADQQLAFFVTLTIFIAVIGPFMEEIFWRGCIQTTLERIVGVLPALLGQAVLFGAIHLRPVGGFIQIFLFGLFAGVWRWRRRTLLPIIIAHIALNSLWCAVRWPEWLDSTKIRITTDYLTQYKKTIGVDKLDPNDNARDFYEKARQSVVDLPPEWYQVKDIWPAQWSPEQHAAISAWLSDNEQSVNYVAQGIQKPYYWPEFNGNIITFAIPDIAWAKKVGFALYILSQIDAADGNLEKSFSDLITCLRFADHFAGRQPTISQIVSFSMRATVTKGTRMILMNVDVSPAKLERLQKIIEQSLANDMHLFDFTVEKFVFYDSIQRIFTDDGNGEGHVSEAALRIPRSFQSLIPQLSKGEKQALLRLDRRDTTILVDLFFNRLARAAKMTAWRFKMDSYLVKKQLELITKQNAFISLLGPTFVDLLNISYRARTDSEALIAILAIFRYKAEKRQLPSSLETLVDQHYLKALPQDSYSFGPLVYKQINNGFLLYSLGADFDDDGGKPSKWGEGEKGGDQIFWPVEGTNEYIELLSKVKE